MTLDPKMMERARKLFNGFHPWTWTSDMPIDAQCNEADIEAIAISLQSVREEALLDAEKAVMAERLVDNTGHAEDEAYDSAVNHCIQAIRNLKSKELK